MNEYNDYGVDYAGLKPGIYIQRGAAIKAVEVATGGGGWQSTVFDLFGLKKNDENTLADREAWTATALSRRAEHLMAVPYAWMQGDTELDEPPFEINDEHLLSQIDKALQIQKYGAFLHKIRSLRKGGLMRLIWLDPDTMQPDMDTVSHKYGMKYFWRTVDAKRKRIPAKDIIWFRRPGQREWEPDPAPLEAARLNASVAYNAARMEDALYEANALPIMMIMVPGGTPDVEVQKLESKFDRLINRLPGTRVSKTIGVREGVEIKALQLTPNDLNLDETVQRHGKAILRVQHVPKSITDSDASNYATAVSDKITFANTMATRMESIANVINKDRDFQAAGVTLEVLRDQLPVAADDELKKAQSFASLVAGRMPPELAAELLGYEIPEGTEFEAKPDPVQLMPPEEEPEPEQDARKMAENDRLDNFIENGTHMKRAFTSDILTQSEIDDAIFAHEWRGYP